MAQDLHIRGTKDQVDELRNLRALLQQAKKDNIALISLLREQQVINDKLVGEFIKQSASVKHRIEHYLPNAERLINDIDEKDAGLGELINSLCSRE